MIGDKSLLGEESIMLMGTPPRSSRTRQLKSLLNTPKSLPSTPEVAEPKSPLDLLCGTDPVDMKLVCYMYCRTGFIRPCFKFALSTVDEFKTKANKLSHIECQYCNWANSKPVEIEVLHAWAKIR